MEGYMKVVRNTSIVVFLMGLTLFMVLAVAACSGNDKKDGGLFAARADDTPTLAVTPTATATPTEPPSPTPSPTPTPFNGKVARLKVPNLRIDYPIEDLALLPNNEMDTPHDANGKVGWYYIYDKPGFRGNAIFSAHINYNKKDGPFAQLSKAKVGDEVAVVMENGTEYKYKILRNDRIPVAKLDMGALIWPSTRPAGTEWVTLITCGGRLGPLDQNGFGEYLDRDVVVAERIF
jgi:sortase (surface protein transpeptidase)